MARFRLIKLTLTPLFVLLLISSCGGGGGSSSSEGNTTKINSPPSFSIMVSEWAIPENQIEVLTAQASDPDGDALSYSMGGEDASLFNVNSMGKVTFKIAPDYEDPSDLDNNNLYSFNVMASDGSLTATSTSFLVQIQDVVIEDCSVEVSDNPNNKVWPSLDWEVSSPEAQGLCPDEINQAMDYAFAANNFTGAVMVIRNGYVIAERYADNRLSSDFVTSWSVAKSFTSALVGIAIDEGSINNLDQSASDYLTSWQGTPKQAITIRQLMNVETALELIDGGTFYSGSDQLQMSLDRQLIGTPGNKLYTYSNSDVMLAGELVRSATQTLPNQYLNSKISSSIGFSGEWWQDSVGNLMTYCCLDATPRDFARFGLLFSRKGNWNGNQIISEQWVNESTATAISGQYGFYWWPAGNQGYTALGVQGQIVGVFPQDDLIVLRFSTYTRMGDGSTIRQGANYHGTSEPQSFDNYTFLGLVHSSLRYYPD